MMENQLLVGTQGEFELARYPAQMAGAKETLRAWDAADEFLLRHLAARTAGQILIVNDSWGALSTALAVKHHPWMLSDSYLSRRLQRDKTWPEIPSRLPQCGC